MIIVQGWVRLAPRDIAALRPAAAAMVAATLAEPGCIAYSFAEDLLEPGVMRIAELWADEAALDAHFATPHMASFNAALAGASLTGASVKAYKGEEWKTLVGG